LFIPEEEKPIMPIPKQDRRPPVKKTVNLHPDTAAWLADYAAQMESEEDYILAAIVQEYKAKNPARATAEAPTRMRSRTAGATA
jgi:hypothetical protein